MTDIINYAGVAFLAALILYMLVLIIRALGEGRLASVGAAAEGERLRAQIDLVMAEHRY